MTCSNVTSINFETAGRYLASLPNRTGIEDECAQLEDDINELNPLNPNYSTLSERRKRVLEESISQLFNDIEKKQHPIHLSPSEIIKKQIEALGNLARKLPTLSSRELHKTIKKALHPDLKEKIYYAVWVADGAPKEYGVGEEKIKTDPGILQRRFPAMFAVAEGTLLEQIGLELEIEFLQAICRENIANDEQRRLLDQLMKQKVAVFQACLKDIKINSRQMKALFNALPETVQSQVPQPPYFGRGFDLALYKTLGAHYDSASHTTTFRVYAPNARTITLNLTAWGYIEHSLRMIKKENGVWELQTKHAQPGRSYHFMIVGKEGGAPFKKIDPFAFGNIIHSRNPTSEDHESIVRDIEKNFPWSDGAWMANRVNINPATTPMAIYEIHPPTWKKHPDGNPLNWKALAPELIAYCKEMGYSHVELMALFEHPQPISMGYQITSFFALNSEMGSIEDFQYFVNCLHEQGIGVIADWVPAHFANNAFSLCSFDGSPLFEDDDPAFAKHPIWGTYEFDFKKQYTKDFLGSNLDFLLNKFHFDGIRVDAVQSMLDLNYGRALGTRVNKNGYDVNLDAKAFLRNLNTYVHHQYPGVLKIAEEAMGFANLTRPVTEKGIDIAKKRGVGFDLTWHLGFVNDILRFFQTSPDSRRLNYAKFIGTVKEVDYSVDSRPRGHVVLAFSHDENANGKKTIFIKMGGNSVFEKFANGRLLLAYQLLRGGGPILDFMGNEILQTQEWHGRLINGLKNEEERKKASVQWEELDSSDPDHLYHRGARESRKVLLHIYRSNPGLQDQSDDGISWIHAEDSENGVLSFHRKGSGQQFACIFNSSNIDLHDYMIPLPDSFYEPELDRLIGIGEIYNTDDIAFGGLGRKNGHVEIVRDPSTYRPIHLKLRLAPFTALVLEEYFSAENVS